jgi:hypothetical protein
VKCWLFRCLGNYWLPIAPEDFQASIDAIRPEAVGRLHGMVIAFGVPA